MEITNDKLVFAMDKENKPVEKAKSGDRLTFHTLDCFCEKLKSEEQKISELDFDRVNPATGPLFVEDAEIGDVLKVKIEKINIKDTGMALAGPGMGVLGEEIKKEKIRKIKIENEKVNFLGRKLSLRKMIGVIGTAPKERSVPTGSPDKHGGNLDCTMVKEKAEIFLPVNTKGALLSMGDLHATMGDGEISGAGLEISGSVEIQIEVIKDFNYKTPLIKADDKIITLGSAKTMEDATKIALLNMADLLMEKMDIDFEDANILLSLYGDVKVCQLVNPNVTMRLEISEDILK